jgi:UrcA family protein
MRVRTTALLLVTGAMGLAFAGSANAAPCGTYGGYDPQPSSSSAENVTVTAPRVEQLQSGPFRLNLPPGRVRISQTVQFADLDLCTGTGARALRERVRATAANICAQLGTTFRGLPSDASCYRDALANAQPKVDFAIGNARGTR